MTTLSNCCFLLRRPSPSMLLRRSSTSSSSLFLSLRNRQSKTYSIINNTDEFAYYATEVADPMVAVKRCSKIDISTMTTLSNCCFLLRRPSPSMLLRRSSTSSSSLFLSLRNRQSKTNSIINNTNEFASYATEVADPMVAVKRKATEVLPALRGTSIFLVGIKSAVKTSLGELLADALRYYYFDSDNLVEEAAGGESSGKSFRERDKEGFHESETEVLKQLSSMGRLVVCAGDGAVQSSTNLALLRHGLSVWIDVPLDMVARDILGHRAQFHASEISSTGSHSEVFDQLTVLYEEMSGGYATADATVSLYGVASQLGYDDFNAVTKEDVTLEVLKDIEKLTRAKKMMEEAARPF